MECRICGGVSLSQASETGFYICQICGAQSQEYQEETAEYDPTLVSRYSISIRRRPQAALTGRVLTFYEAFQHILKLQVTSLINEHGMSTRLAEIVGFLWDAYLRHAPAPPPPPPVKVRPKRRKPTVVTSYRTEIQKQLDQANAATQQQRADNQNNDGSSDSSSDSSSDDEPNNTSTDIGKDEIPKVKRKQNRPYATPLELSGYPRFELSLCFCLIGCLWLREPMLTIDIIR
jgi:hypothetical protein